MGDQIEQFRIEVEQEVLDDLRERLDRTRWPDQIPDTGWDYGTDMAWLQDLCGYWRQEFDWRAHEAALNQWDHFRTEIDGQNIHFIHARSPHEDATPLLISHGWPGTVSEFVHVIDPLRDPTAHGGDAADAFHVVTPSLPGYGWSGPTADRGWSSRRIAEAWAQLMARLGYDRYIAQGGDWGAMISTQMGLVDAEHLAGIHINMVIAVPPDDTDWSQMSEEDNQALVEAAAFLEEGTGYQSIQGTRPQTLGYGLTDSPAGLAAWIGEKYLAWTDNEGTPESAVSRDDLLGIITTYWVTRTINSSVRLYYESRKAGYFGPHRDKVEVPTGAAIFPKEIIRPPRTFAEDVYNIVHWSSFDRGGHFAALEEPDLLVQDVREFARKVR